MVELNWTHEAEQWLHDIYDYISKENPDAALQTIESIYKNIHKTSVKHNNEKRFNA